MFGGEYKMHEITCLLIRHGKTKGNIEKRYVGCKTDEELCDIGTSELKACGLSENETLIYKKVFVSPLRRCIQTSEILFPMHEIEIVDDFREIDFGEFENKNYLELKDNGDYQAWIDSGGEMTFPNGESRDEFVARNVNAFKKVVMQLDDKAKDCIIPFVIHGGSIMAIMSTLTGEEYFDFQIPCSGAYKLKLSVGEKKIDVISYDRIYSRCDS